MKRIIVLLVILLCIAGFFIFDLNQYLDFAYIKSRQQIITDYFHSHPVKTSTLFFITYILVAALSLPGAAIYQF